MHPKTVVFSNSMIKDRIEIIQNSKEKLIFRTYLEANGGQNQLHYHCKLIESFKIVEGELTVIIHKNKKKLKAGETYTILPRTHHMFVNTSDKPVTFEVDVLNPQKMMLGLQLIYGLANDGKSTKKGLPKNLFHIAICLQMLDTLSPRVPYRIQKTGISLLAYIGKFLGIENTLLKKYRQ